MCNRKKHSLKILPGFIVVSLLIISGMLKLSGHHPMLLHFVELGVDEYLGLLGVAEIILALLFLFPPTTRVGLLLLTAYFGGAIAMEIPYHMVFGPAIPLIMVWIAAFIREPKLFVKPQPANE
jgi:hypothetical protein